MVRLNSNNGENNVNLQFYSINKSFAGKRRYFKKIEQVDGVATFQPLRTQQKRTKMAGITTMPLSSRRIFYTNMMLLGFDALAFENQHKMAFDE